MIKLTADRFNHCRECKGIIRPGDAILWWGKVVRHADCYQGMHWGWKPWEHPNCWWDGVRTTYREIAESKYSAKCTRCRHIIRRGSRCFWLAGSSRLWHPGCYVRQFGED